MPFSDFPDWLQEKLKPFRDNRDKLFKLIRDQYQGKGIVANTDWELPKQQRKLAIDLAHLRDITPANIPSTVPQPTTTVKPTTDMFLPAMSDFLQPSHYHQPAQTGAESLPMCCGSSTRRKKSRPPK